MRFALPAAAGTYHIQATSMADASVSATVPVTVERVGVSISPAQATLAPGASQQFAATAAGTENTQVTWQVQETGGGQIDPSGSYTAPSSTGTYHVSAYSAADPSKSATATVLVPSHTLSVALASGVTGTPAATTSATHGQVISYSYAPASGYTNLQVQVDGHPASASGIIVMDGDHSITLSADIEIILVAPPCSLTTTVAGAVGAPVAGTGSYAQDTVVAYSYALQSGYENLVVALDNSPIAASGTLTMNGDHHLDVSASQVIVVIPIPYTLTVNLGAGTSGIPGATCTYNPGTAVTYAYALTASAPSGYVLQVLVDGATAPATGTLTMDADHAITVSAVVAPITVTVAGITPGDYNDIYAGLDVTYVANVTGGLPPYSFQWIQDPSITTPLGATWSTDQYLQLVNVTSSYNGNWRLVVTDSRHSSVLFQWLFLCQH